MGEVVEINGPIVSIRQPGVRNGDQVRIGSLGLIGEVIHIRREDALVQVYESTESLRPGEEVVGGESESPYRVDEGTSRRR